MKRLAILWPRAGPRRGGCGSGQDDDTATRGDSGGDDVQLTQGSDLTIAMVTHSDEGSFWSVVKKGAEQAAKDEGVKLIWSPSNNDPQKEAQLIDAAVSQKVDGLAVSVPNADAIKGALAKAKRRRHPDHHAQLGRRRLKALGAITHVGQDEAIAGQAAGARFKAEGAKKVLCIIHEQSNIGLQQRCDGVKQGFGGTVDQPAGQGHRGHRHDADRDQVQAAGRQVLSTR